jgi:hypothetical protein
MAFGADSYINMTFVMHPDSRSVGKCAGVHGIKKANMCRVGLLDKIIFIQLFG